MLSRSLWLAAFLFVAVIAFIAWPGQAQSPAGAKATEEKALEARLDRIEKQLAEIQDLLKKIEIPKTGWQKIKDGTNVVVYMEATSGKIKYIYTDGTERVTEK
jgi:preprotein translocase subunit SecF